ncbi:MAG: serine hydrolase, partial [Bacteroidota bacterium]
RIEHLLSHASGLPDIIFLPEETKEEDLLSALFDQDIWFTSGERFNYNQTNHWLLQQIIEKVANQDFEEFVFHNQFFNDANKAFFSSNSIKVFPNRAQRYQYNQWQELELDTYQGDSLAHSGNGLNINLPAFIQWNQSLDEARLLKEATKSLMWSEFDFADENSSFLRGWGIYDVNGVRSIGFTGGGVSGFRKFPEQNLTIIFLTNGYKYFPVHNVLIDHIAGLIEPFLKDEMVLETEEVINGFLSMPIANALKNYKAAKAKMPDLDIEDRINSIGYTLMRNGKLADAIQVFEQNVKDHPESWNVYDSLGEAYAMQGNKSKAIELYEKSLQVNPENTNGIEQLKILREG